MLILFLLIIGAVVGSFLNVCIYRLPRNESVVWPASHCPACGKVLTPVELVPVISFLFLRGKCAGCRAPISVRYPIVELMTALLFVSIWNFTGGNLLHYIFYLIFVLGLLVILFIDLEHMLMPDVVSFGGIFFGLVFAVVKAGAAGSLTPLFDPLLGGLLGLGFFFSVAKLGGLWFKKEVIGEGDFYLAAFMGVYLGVAGLIVALFVAYLSAAIVAGIMLMGNKVKMDNYIPFGPALAFGGLVSLLCGQTIILWYIGAFWQI
ncbi:MAG: prepilin peptidase [Candidatus Margulisiibacteriota bacterium]|jgi:leader peptidase (prepilin peptidase)/N-methyltransferase